MKKEYIYIYIYIIHVTKPTYTVAYACACAYRTRCKVIGGDQIKGPHRENPTPRNQIECIRITIRCSE